MLAGAAYHTELVWHRSRGCVREQRAVVAAMLDRQLIASSLVSALEERLATDATDDMVPPVPPREQDWRPHAARLLILLLRRELGVKQGGPRQACSVPGCILMNAVSCFFLCSVTAATVAMAEYRRKVFMLSKTEVHSFLDAGGAID